MAMRPPIRLPDDWSRHVKRSILQAISLASVAFVAARGRASRFHRYRAKLAAAEAEIALLKEELSIKDGRWERSRTRRRPHYTPTQRLRILQLRAARGWNLEMTARVFLIDFQTLNHWLRRLDEQDAPIIVQTPRPINRYPDFVRHIVRQLKRLFPSMGYERIAQLLARAGLALGKSTVRRMVREACPRDDDVIQAARRRRRVVAKHPGHTWHVDLTAVPTRAGFWLPWFPLSLAQRWPFGWWICVVVDQFSRSLVGFEIFRSLPSSEQVQHFLERTIRSSSNPRYIVTDKGKQFFCRSFKRWCKARSIRPRYGAVGQPASIAIVERFIRSMKQEACRWLLVPLQPAAMRKEIDFYAIWYNEHRPHTALNGRTPREVWNGRLRRRRRFEPRPKWSQQRRCPGGRLQLAVSYVGDRKHLPIVGLRRAA